MESQKINAMATSMIAFSTFLATWIALVYYSIVSFNLKGLELSLISEIYILLTILFIEWIRGKVK